MPDDRLASQFALTTAVSPANATPYPNESNASALLAFKNADAFQPASSSANRVAAPAYPASRGDASAPTPRALLASLHAPISAPLSLSAIEQPNPSFERGK